MRHLKSVFEQVPGDHGDKKYHYWFAESEGNPKKDPIALYVIPPESLVGAVPLLMLSRCCACACVRV